MREILVAFGLAVIAFWLGVKSVDMDSKIANAPCFENVACTQTHNVYMHKIFGFPTSTNSH